MVMWLQAEREDDMGQEGLLDLDRSLQRVSGILAGPRTAEAVQAAFMCGWPGFASDFTQAFAFALDSKVSLQILASIDIIKLLSLYICVSSTQQQSGQAARECLPHSKARKVPLQGT